VQIAQATYLPSLCHIAHVVYVNDVVIFLRNQREEALRELTDAVQPLAPSKISGGCVMQHDIVDGNDLEEKKREAKLNNNVLMLFPSTLA